jgi:hypothetical protein
MYAYIIFVATVVLYFVVTWSYHSNPSFGKCFYNQRSNFLFHFNVTLILVFSLSLSVSGKEENACSTDKSEMGVSLYVC